MGGGSGMADKVLSFFMGGGYRGVCLVIIHQDVYFYAIFNTCVMFINEKVIKKGYVKINCPN